MDRCVNCNIAFNRCNTLGRRALNNDLILTVFQRWRTLATISRSDHVCQACWNMAQEVVSGTLPIDEPRIGHLSVCVRCSRSLSTQQYVHRLNTESARETRIYNVIREWILPQSVDSTSRICHACWVSADRAAKHMTTGPSTSSQLMPSVELQPAPVLPTVQADEQEPTPSVQIPPHVPDNPTVQADEQEPTPPVVIPPEVPVIPIVQPDVPANNNWQHQTIFLPDYMRALETESRCFIEGCRRTERYRVPLSTRKMLLIQHKFYVPDKNRLCDQHLILESWDFLDSLRNNYVQQFTAKHIQDMLALKDVSDSTLICFDHIDDMDEHVLYKWIGFNKTQYYQLLDEFPQILEIRRGSLAFIAYLMKLRTGDSDERLATLLKVSRRTLERWLHQIRELLTEYFVPMYLGLNHINRQQIVARNLVIPNTLFGNYEGEDRPIVIFDGTYCYVEKSSNYLYQKRTYSLHKYRNLVKPFMIVCADGYIIDVLGPYPATTSDSDIMKKEFSNNRPLKEYFRDGDAFILDRGFRDSLPMLNQCGYRTYVPASLEEGETQLSTSQANKSRAVTICRWVVEVVNGRFKRDFKLLRQNYFNVASRSFMRDFEVAAALLNKFHPPIVDRVDAGEIIIQINLYMSVNNDLADFIIRHNYNRLRAGFEVITAHNDNLNDFPQLTESELILISLGTYQIKQARSYFGEHVRENAGFVIEVCRESSSRLLRELSTSNTLWLLRGRIHSRHISRKTYFVYILVDNSRSGREAILQHYCNCIVGKRTVGCCAHIMCIIWYLSWARHQDNIAPPAQFLDNILIIIEEDE